MRCLICRLDLFNSKTRKNLKIYIIVRIELSINENTQSVYFLEKYDKLSELVALVQKLRYFTDQNGPKGGPQESEFLVFSNSEMNVTNS